MTRFRAVLWALAFVQVLTIQPSRPFALPVPFTWEHGAFIAGFLLTSAGFLRHAGRRARTTLLVLHVVIVAVLAALHPLTTFGRDGSVVVLLIWLVVAIAHLPVRRELVAASASLCVGLVLVETLLSFGREPSTAGQPDYGDVIGEYGACGFLKPNLDLSVVGEDGEARFVTDRLGLRRAPASTAVATAAGAPPARDGRTTRVLFIGDSFVAGYRTDQGDLAGVQLERRLDEGRPAPVEVLTAGAGYPGAAAPVVRTCGAIVTPDVVLTGITVGNDLAQSWFESRGLRQDALDSLLLPDDATRGYLGLLPVRVRASLDAWRLFRRIDDLVSTDVLRSWYVERPGAVHVFDPGQSLGLFYARRSLPVVDEAYADLFRSLDEVAAEATRLGAHPVFVVLPQRFQMTDREWSATLFALGLDPAAFDRDLPDRRIREGCAARHLDCVDLLDAFRAAARTESLYQPAGDMHWNRRGQAVAATVLAGRLGPLLAGR